MESAKQLCEGHRAVVSCWYVSLLQQLFQYLNVFTEVEVNSGGYLPSH